LAKTDIQGNWLENFLGKKIIASSLPSGLYISTFGKIIKGGWEWLGIMPKNAQALSGVVEIPALSEILTTNKNDFLSDSASLKKYYKFRKAVQEAVLPILEQLGESREKPRVAPEKLMKPLSRAISGALNNLLGDFPELEGLVGAGRSTLLGRKSAPSRELGALSGSEQPSELAHEDDSGHDQAGRENQTTKPPFGVADSSKKREVRARTSGFTIALADIEDSPKVLLGRIIDNILTINTAHPAWIRAKQRGMEEYHILIVSAAVLSEFLEESKSPQEFLNRFLQSWANAEAEAKAGKLF